MQSNLIWTINWRHLIDVDITVYENNNLITEKIYMIFCKEKHVIQYVDIQSGKGALNWGKCANDTDVCSHVIPYTCMSSVNTVILLFYKSIHAL